MTSVRAHVQRLLETGLRAPTSPIIGYTMPMMKDSGLRIRVQRDLREKLLEVCHTQDKPAAQVIREFMRSYIDWYEVQDYRPGADKPRLGQRLSHEH